MVQGVFIVPTPVAKLHQADFYQDGGVWKLHVAGLDLSPDAMLASLRRVGSSAQEEFVVYPDLRELRPTLPHWPTASLRVTVVQYDRLDGRCVLSPSESAHISLWRPRKLPRKARPLVPADKQPRPGLGALPSLPVFERLLLELMKALQANLADPTGACINLAGPAVWFTPRRLYLLDAGVFQPADPRLIRERVYDAALWQLVRTFFALHLKRRKIEGRVEYALPRVLLEGEPTMERLFALVRASRLSHDEEAMALRARVCLVSETLREELVRSVERGLSPAGTPRLQLAATAETEGRALLGLLPVTLPGFTEADGALLRLEGGLPPLLQRWKQSRAAIHDLLLLYRHAEGEKVKALQALQDARANHQKGAQESEELKRQAGELRGLIEGQKADIRALQRERDALRAENDELQKRPENPPPPDRTREIEDLKLQLRQTQAERNRLWSENDSLRSAPVKAPPSAQPAGVAGRSVAVVFDLLLPGLVAGWAVLSGTMEIPPEFLFLLCMVVLLGRGLWSPGLWATRLVLVAVGEGNRPVGLILRGPSAMMHYAGPVAAAVVAVVLRDEGRAIVQPVFAGQVGQFEAAQWLIVAALLWLAGLIGSALLSPVVMRARPLAHGCTWIEWWLHLGVQRLGETSSKK